MFSNCVSKGKHSLKVIISSGPDQELTVVRWCEVCGAVVIDIDCDGRTNFGSVLPMQFPKILTQCLEINND